MDRLRYRWPQVGRGLLSVFLESSCILCGAPAAELCSGCQQQLQRCRLDPPLDLSHAALPLLAWGRYQGSLRRAIATLKYEQPTLANFLGRQLGLLWQQHPLTARPLQVVPIPLHPERQRQRGYNQAALLAESFCRVTGHRLQAQGLRRIRATLPQHGLGQQARADNLKDAFQVAHSLERTRPVLLIDDIYTTGSTAQAAAAALAAQGISVLGIGTMARAISSATRVHP